MAFGMLVVSERKKGINIDSHSRVAGSKLVDISTSAQEPQFHTGRRAKEFVAAFACSPGSKDVCKAAEWSGEKARHCPVAIILRQDYTCLGLGTRMPDFPNIVGKQGKS